MKSGVAIAVVLSLCFCTSLFGRDKDDPDDFCLWMSVNVRKNIGTRWSVGALAEFRLDNNCTKANQYYIRPVLNYKIASWLTAGAQVDFTGTRSGFQMRYLPEITATYNVSSWSFSIRERYLATWKMQADSWSHTLRTKINIAYRIPGTNLALASAVEPFYLRDVSKVRVYAGIIYAIDNVNSIQTQYLREQYFSRHSNNVIWITYKVNF